MKLTGSNPKRSLSSSLFFLSFSLTPHIHLIILILVRFIFNSCSTFRGQVSLPCVRQLLTQVAYTLPFSFNENPFPVRMGRYSRNYSAHKTKRKIKTDVPVTGYKNVVDRTAVVVEFALLLFCCHGTLLYQDSRLLIRFLACYLSVRASWYTASYTERLISSTKTVVCVVTVKCCHCCCVHGQV